MSGTKFTALLVVVISLLVIAVPVSAATLTEAQITSILNLLSSFGADQATINNVTVSLRGTGTPVPATLASCVNLDSNLYKGASDSRSGGEVSKLQQFLGGRVTGYFGPATYELVKAWQSSHGIATTASTAGNVGPATRAAMACK